MTTTAPTAPLPVQATVTAHHIRRHVFPFLTDGVAMAVVAAHPSLRLSAETYRADENFTRTLRQQGKFIPRVLDDNKRSEFEAYESKVIRRCGVRVGPLVMVRRDTSESHHRHREAALLAELTPAAGRHHHRWSPANGHLPPLSFTDSEDFYYFFSSVQDALVADGFPSSTAVMSAGLGAAAEAPSAMLAKRRLWGHWTGGEVLSDAHSMLECAPHVPDLRAVKPLEADEPVLSKLVRLRDEAQYRLLWSHIQRSVAHDEGLRGCDNGDGGNHQQQLGWDRVLYLWTEGVRLPASILNSLSVGNGGLRGCQPTDLTEEFIHAIVELVDHSLWWLLRPLQRQQSPSLGSSEVAPLSMPVPTHLHLFSSAEAHVQAACHALCSNFGHQRVPLQLEGFHLFGQPAGHLSLGADGGTAALFPQETLAHMRVLQVAHCKCTPATLRAAFWPFVRDHDGVERPAGPPTAADSAPLFTWMPRLETVDLSDNQDLDGFPLLWPACLPREEDSFKLELRRVNAELLPHLTALDLSRTTLSDEWIGLIALGCRHLIALSITYCLGVTTLCGLARNLETGEPTGLARTLCYLNASITAVTDKGIAALSELVRLLAVDLSNCAQLTDVTPLVNLPRLRTLLLSNCRLTKGLDRLHASGTLEQLVCSAEYRPWRDAGNPQTEAAARAGLFPLRAGTMLPAMVPSRSVFRSLTRLSIASVQWFTDASFATLALSSVPLEALTLVDLRSFSSFAGLAQESSAVSPGKESGLCDTLQVLVLERNPRLNMEGARALALCRALRLVTLMSCDGLSSIGSVLSKVASLRVLSIASAGHADARENEGVWDQLLAGYAVEAQGREGVVVGSGAEREKESSQLEVLLLEDAPHLRDLSFLSGMPRLKVLKASDTALTTTGLAVGVEAHLLAASACTSRSLLCPPITLSSLLSIDLSYCEFVHDVSCLTRLPSLRSLCLTMTGITDAGLQELLFSPSSFLEILDLSNCQAVALEFESPLDSLIERYWEKESSVWSQRCPVTSSLKKLFLIGNRGVSHRSLTRIFAPFRRLQRSSEGKNAGSPHGCTYFANLSTLDLSMCRTASTIDALAPLAGCLRELVLRSTLVNTKGLEHLHKLQLLESLDLQDTTRIGSLAAVLSHPRLRTLDLRGLHFHSDDSDVVQPGECWASGAATAGIDGPIEERAPLATGAEAAERELLLPFLAPPVAGACDLFSSSSVLAPPTTLMNSALEVLSFSFNSSIFETVIAPILLHGAHPSFGGLSAGLVHGEPASGCVHFRTLPALCTLRYHGSPTMRISKAADEGILPDDRAATLSLIKLLRPQLVVTRI